MGLNTVQNLIIGSILFVVIITGGVLWMGTFYTSDSTLDSTGAISRFNNTLDKSATVTASANQIKSDIESTSGSGALGWLNTLINTAFNGMKATFGSLSFIGTMLTDVGSYFGISETSGMLVLVGLVVVIIIGFAIYAAIMRVNI